MKQILIYAQIVVSILLITVILMQSKGSGLGEVFGGTGNVYSTKRGAEKFLHILTIILAIFFLGLAFFSLFLK